MPVQSAVAVVEVNRFRSEGVRLSQIASSFEVHVFGRGLLKLASASCSVVVLLDGTVLDPEDREGVEDEAPLDVLLSREEGGEEAWLPDDDEPDALVLGDAVVDEDVDEEETALDGRVDINTTRPDDLLILLVT